MHVRSISSLGCSLVLFYFHCAQALVVCRPLWLSFLRPPSLSVSLTPPYPLLLHLLVPTELFERNSGLLRP